MFSDLFNDPPKFLLSLDVETDGLYGDVFAIGASVWSLSDPLKPISTFYGHAEVTKVTNDFVIKEVLPKLPLTINRYATRRELRDAFWQFYMRHKRNSLVLGDFIAPCEAYLFRLCVLDDKTREFECPYPLHDLGTMLYMKGINPDIDRIAFIGDINDMNLRKHNPLDDSIIQALTFFKLKDIK